MKRSKQFMSQLLDAIASNPNIAQTCARLRVGQSTVFAWVQQSREANKVDKTFVLEWGDRIADLATHWDRALKFNALAIEHNARARAANGHEEQIYFHGVPTFYEDDKLVGLDDETLEMLGYPDRFLRDEFGRRVPVMRHVEPPEGLVVKMLTSLNRPVFGEKSETDLRVSGGVLVVGRQLGAEEFQEKFGGKQPIRQIPILNEPMRQLPMPMVIDAEYDVTDLTSSTADNAPRAADTTPPADTPPAMVTTPDEPGDHLAGDNDPPTSDVPADNDPQRYSGEPVERVGPGTVPPGGMKVA